MVEGDFAAVATKLATADPDGCDRTALTELVALSNRARGWLDAFDSRIARRAGTLEANGRCESPGMLLSGGGRRSGRDARAAANRSKLCDEIPELETAMASGSLSAGHVDAVARTAKTLDEAGRARLIERGEDLIALGESRTVEAFERECVDLARELCRDEGVTELQQQRRCSNVKRWTDRQTGMFHTHIELDAERGSKLWLAIDHEAMRLRQRRGRTSECDLAQCTVDAVVGLTTNIRPPGGERARPEIIVLVDYTTLMGGLGDGSVCETSNGVPLPPSTVRRLCCDADIVPAVLGGAGELMELGRSQRVANRAQRRALRVMYRTCAHPDCHVPFEHCEIHHVTPWEYGGLTDLDNLLPVCTSHHHLVHEGRWHLKLRSDREITLHRPDGNLYFEGNTTDRVHSASDHLTRPPPRAPAA